MKRQHSCVLSVATLACSWPAMQAVYELGHVLAAMIAEGRVATVVRTVRSRGWYGLQFFAEFCLTANGAYLSIGLLGRVGDAGDILRHRSPVVLLWMFGLITIPLGLCLWYGLGPQFGIGGDADRKVAFAIVTLLFAAIALEMLFSHPTVH